MRVLVAGEGAIAQKHCDALERVEGVQLVALVGGNGENTAELAAARNIPYWSLDLADTLRSIEVDAVILATPTPLHASHAELVLKAGKPVLIEIPMADNIEDARKLVEIQKETGLTAMVCHTRRFNPGHQWLHKQFEIGELKLQQLVVETYFYRRDNVNALGKARDWTDHLLWHHACHGVDLFQYQTKEIPDKTWAIAGPVDEKLGIAMDMNIGMQAPSGALCTIALSFNNNGPLGSSFRYICNKGTYIARYDELVDGYAAAVDLGVDYTGKDGIELQDREFLTAIRENREPNACLAQCLTTMNTVDRLEASL